MIKERLNFLEGLESAIEMFLRFPYENEEETIIGLECLSVTELKNIRDSIENLKHKYDEFIDDNVDDDRIHVLYDKYAKCYMNMQINIVTYIIGAKLTNKEIPITNETIKCFINKKTKKKGIFEGSFFEALKESLDEISEKDLKLLEAIIEYKRS